jgi:hypothetical protein
LVFTKPDFTKFKYGEKMKKIFVLAFIVILCMSCTSKMMPYVPDTTYTNENAKLVIEQVLMEQPLQYVPSAVIFSEGNFELNLGIQTRTEGNSGGIFVINGLFIGSNSNTSKSKKIKKRIYYNSIIESKIYTHGSWHIVQLIDTESKKMHKFYCRNELKAKRFSDALMSLKHNSKITLNQISK